MAGMLSVNDVMTKKIITTSNKYLFFMNCQGGTPAKREQ